MYLRGAGLDDLVGAESAYELRESAADHLQLGRAAKWRYATPTAPPGIRTAEARAALLRYISEKTIERFGFTEFPDDADERWLLEEWSAPPKYTAFGLPAHQYGVCLIFPRDPGADDPIARVRCDLCSSMFTAPMPEFVPIPSHIGDWILRWPWHRGPVTGICRACEPVAATFELAHSLLGDGWP